MVWWIQKCSLPVIACMDMTSSFDWFHICPSNLGLLDQISRDPKFLPTKCGLQDHEIKLLEYEIMVGWIQYWPHPNLVSMDMRPWFDGSNIAHEIKVGWMQYWSHPTLVYMDMRSRLDWSNIGPTQPSSACRWLHGLIDPILVIPTIVYLEMTSFWEWTNIGSTQHWWNHVWIDPILLPSNHHVLRDNSKVGFIQYSFHPAILY